LGIQREMDLGIQRETDLGIQRETDLGIQRETDLGIQRETDLGIQRESNCTVQRAFRTHYLSPCFGGCLGWFVCFECLKHAFFEVNLGIQRATRSQNGLQHLLSGCVRGSTLLAVSSNLKRCNLTMQHNH